MTDTPLHIRPPWQKIAARFQSVARTNGYAIVQMTVVVNEHGNPVVWREPIVTRLEPKPKSCTNAVAELLRLLTEE